MIATAKLRAVSSDPTSFTFALAGLAGMMAQCDTVDEQIRARVQEAAREIDPRKPLLASFFEYLKRPAEEDAALVALASRFSFTMIETLAVRLAVAAEEDLFVGHLLAHLQQPLAHSRPSISLLARAYGQDLGVSAVQLLGQGAAVRCGLLQLSAEELPLPERQVRVPLPACLALQQIQGPWPGAALIRQPYPVWLGESAEQRATAIAAKLFPADPQAKQSPVLIIRCGDVTEARAAAQQVCSHDGRQAVLVHTEQTLGMACWLFLNGYVPVFTHWLGPGERKAVPTVACYPGAIIVLTGPDGEFESDDRAIIEWPLDVPPAEERERIWAAATGDTQLAQRLATDHRHTAGRIASLAAKALEKHTAPDAAPGYEEIRAIARSGAALGLGSLAELIGDEVTDEALVVSPELREDLESLVARCRLRERFAGTLGPSMKARYRAAVRAMFVGPSGTGKTLAAAWLATRLGMPLYRVDLSAVTSKYIGETEKNLGQLLTRAEQNEVVLLFDEADSLFGKRTDVREANDRFANAQTNYLLQRMESYDGITLLTSNNRSRLDNAFSRRLDAIIEFPAPGPEQRRALWLAHLGDAHALESPELNLVAARADLSGGQIRNAVLSAAVVAAREGNAIAYRHVLQGLTGEYRKLSRQLPTELQRPGVS